MKFAEILPHAIHQTVFSLPVGMVLVNDRFEYVEANNTWLDMLGYSADELLNTTFLEITHPDDRSVDEELSKRVFAREIPYFRIKKRWIRRDGSIMRGTLTATVVDGSDATRWGFGAITAEDHALRANADAVLAHELRNLLFVIAGNVALLNDDLAQPDTNANKLESLDAIQKSVELAVSLTESLLAPASSVCAISCDAIPVIRKCVSMFNSIARMGITVTTELDVRCANVLIGETQLTQALLNLLRNSQDAMGDSGLIVTRARSSEKMLEISVCDDGKGMSPEVLSRATNPFFTTKKGHGSGIGLAVIDETLKEVGGWIQMESEPNQGTTVTLFIPTRSA